MWSSLTLHVNHRVRLVRLLDERIAALYHLARLIRVVLRHFLQRLTDQKPILITYQVSAGEGKLLTYSRCPL